MSAFSQDGFRGFPGNQLRIWQFFDPVTKRLPLIQFMVFPAVINIGQNLIVEHERRFLKPSYVSIVALLPRPEGIGDSLYRFISKI